MRILLVSGPARGGMLTWVRQAARVLASEEGAVALAAPYRISGIDSLTSFQLPVGQGIFPGRDVTDGLRLASRAFGADLLHAHGLRAGFAARQTGLPFAYTLHGFPPGGAGGKLFRLAEGRVIRSARALCAVSEELASYARSSGRAATVLAPLPAVSPVPLPLVEGHPVFGTLARLSPEKGVDVLLAAFSRLHRQEGRARLVVGGEGPERARLEALASSLGIGRETSFLGWVDDPKGFFGHVSIYVQPSRREGFGLAAREAVSMGRPVVVSDTGGLPEAAGQGPWARRVPPGDAERLAEAMAALLHDDLQKLGEMAHAFACAEAARDDFGRGLLTFYQGALKNSGTGPSGRS